MFVHKRYIITILSALCLQIPLYAFNDAVTQSLIDGIKEANALKVRKSIENGADINAQIIGDNKETPLMLALREYTGQVKEHFKLTSPWSLAALGSFVGLGVGIAGVLSEPERAVYQKPSKSYYPSRGAILISALSIVATTALSLNVSNFAMRDIIFNDLLNNPRTDVTVKNIKGETVLNILDSYVSTFKVTKYAMKRYNYFRELIEKKIDAKNK